MKTMLKSVVLSSNARLAHEQDSQWSFKNARYHELKQPNKAPSTSKWLADFCVSTLLYACDE